jgi:hypothetical protein
MQRSALVADVMLQMKAFALVAAGVLSIGSAQSLACSCTTVVVDTTPDREKQRWLAEMAGGSETVVLARITYVAPYSDGAGNVGQYGVLEVREVLKGSPPPTIEVTTGWCVNLVLNVEEERVFFIVPGGRVQGCSEYRHAMTDEDVAMTLRKWRRESAT